MIDNDDEFTYTQYDGSHLVNGSFFGEDKFVLKHSGDENPELWINVHSVRFADNPLKWDHFDFYFSKEQVADFITALTYWHDHVAK
jgi:hypothetical protein